MTFVLFPPQLVEESRSLGKNEVSSLRLQLRSAQDPALDLSKCTVYAYESIIKKWNREVTFKFSFCYCKEETWK